MPDSIFKEKFEDNLTYKKSAQAIRLMHYFFAKIESNENNEGFDPQKMSIEHILPQNPKEWNLTKNQVKGYVNKVGNLTLVFEDDNGKMGNKILTEKLPILKKSRLTINNRFIENLKKDDDALIWNEAEIDSRTKELCEIALNIWKI